MEQINLRNLKIIIRYSQGPEIIKCAPNNNYRRFHGYKTAAKFEIVITFKSSTPSFKVYDEALAIKYLSQKKIIEIGSRILENKKLIKKNLAYFNYSYMLQSKCLMRYRITYND